MDQLTTANADALTKNVWNRLQIEAREQAGNEQVLSSLLHAKIITQETFCRALASHLAEILEAKDLTAIHLRKMVLDIYRSKQGLIDAATQDLQAVFERDPACVSYVQCFLYFKGFAVLQIHRVAHELLRNNRDMLAYYMQSRMSELFGVDINPAAKIGAGIMLDHATGIVVGETAVIGDGCSILHGVTLGGTGKQHADRHPKIGKNVLIGAGAKILGNIKIGDGARIAAGSVVLKPVGAHCTVAGVPAKVVGGPCCENPAAEMDQILDA
ncbi:MAG TPA: serine O-acetyltransferase [Hellea balneolensis]|uniref:Serine acetyltransferase n=1 Tax=Hellea balneolensis TaxID=287478 RepID=A0A7C5QW13_9PROT|nr:serine O-acetyltransferase [Hellea balneolensis]